MTHLQNHLYMYISTNFTNIHNRALLVLINYKLRPIKDIYVTGCRPSVSAHTPWDLGELRSLTERDSSIPHSTPGAVPLVPMHIQEPIISSQPVCRQAGGYEKYKRQYLTHNVWIIVTRVREIQREECNSACSPNPELMLLLDPSPIPDPCLTMFQGKGAPDNSCLPFYTAHEAWDDVCWWCKDCIIKCHTSPQTSSTGTSGGKQVAGSWAHSQTSGMWGPHYKIKKLNTQAKGQWAACDTLPPGSPAWPHDNCFI